MNDDKTPVERPPIPVNPAHRGIVRALQNHALVLEQVRRTVEAVRDAFVRRTDVPSRHEVDELARVMRSESDSAVVVAQQAEKLAKATR